MSRGFCIEKSLDSGFLTIPGFCVLGSTRFRVLPDSAVSRDSGVSMWLWILEYKNLLLAVIVKGKNFGILEYNACV